MKIIISRKGFDSGAGWCPSPILPDGSIISFPIPDGASRKRYRDVTRTGFNLGDIVSHLSPRVRHRHLCHLDPDLDAGAIKRLPGWRPAFGQTGAAQTHLAGEGVEIGDLFLFFGWFREAEPLIGGRVVDIHQAREATGSLQGPVEDGKMLSWRWKPKAPQLHLLHGWMQIDEILSIDGNKADILARYPWLHDHPHLHRRDDKNNHIYLGREYLSLPSLPSPMADGKTKSAAKSGRKDKGLPRAPGAALTDSRVSSDPMGNSLPGAGAFNRFRDALVLTDREAQAKGGGTRSLWSLPSFFMPSADTRLSYHDDPTRWGRSGERVQLKSASRGQEFVFRHGVDLTPAVAAWLMDIFSAEGCLA